jgi:hypothetical protein
MQERLPPGGRVQIVAVDERAIDVEKYSANHEASLG